MDKEYVLTVAKDGSAALRLNGNFQLGAQNNSMWANIASVLRGVEQHRETVQELVLLGHDDEGGRTYAVRTTPAVASMTVREGDGSGRVA